jgi:hypothetical protein
MASENKTLPTEASVAALLTEAYAQNRANPVLTEVLD